MNERLNIFKALADENRLKIICALNERDMYAELLAERLKLNPATVSFHMKKLVAAGLVDATKQQYYTIYSIRKQAFDMTLSDIVSRDEEQDAIEQQREEMYRRKVLKSFMPDGYLVQLPVQFKKRLIVYEEIYRLFEPNRAYPEKEVNETILKVYDDFCMVRREFIMLGWMTREKGIYHLIGDGITPPYIEL